MTNGAGQLQYFPPTDVAGTVTIQASVAGSFGSTSITITEADTFFISFVDPNFSTPAGGDEAFIHGSGFDDPVRVSFGNANARVLSVSPTRIRVRIPESPGQPNQRLTVPVSVTINVNQADQATDTLPGAFTYAPGGAPDVPTVFSLTPASGPNEGGTRVVINGSGFAAPVQVELCDGGTCLEAQVLSVAAGRIEILTPAATGFGSALRGKTVDVRVRNLDSGLTATFPASFRYGLADGEVQITGLSPVEGTYRGGTLVTLFGQGFDAPVQVTIGNVEQGVVSVTGTEVVFRTAGILVSSCPSSGIAFSGPVLLTNLETGQSASSVSGPANLQFRYSVQIPQILTVSPTAGPQAGATLVTIGGSGFESPARVRFTSSSGGADPFNGSVQTVTSGQITVRTPAVTNDAFKTEPCDDNGDGTQGVRFIPTAFAVEVVNVDTTCAAQLTNAFTFNPTNTTCRNDDGEAPPAVPQCNDGIDNDGDTLIDFPADPQCTDLNDNTEAS